MADSECDDQGRCISGHLQSKEIDAMNTSLVRGAATKPMDNATASSPRIGMNDIASSQAHASDTVDALPEVVNHPCTDDETVEHHNDLSESTFANPPAMSTGKRKWSLSSGEAQLSATSSVKRIRKTSFAAAKAPEEDGNESAASSGLSSLPSDFELKSPPRMNEQNTSAPANTKRAPKRQRLSDEWAAFQISGPATDRPQRIVKQPDRYGVTGTTETKPKRRGMGSEDGDPVSGNTPVVGALARTASKKAASSKNVSAEPANLMTQRSSKRRKVSAAARADLATKRLSEADAASGKEQDQEEDVSAGENIAQGAGRTSKRGKQRPSHAVKPTRTSAARTKQIPSAARVHEDNESHGDHEEGATEENQTNEENALAPPKGEVAAAETAGGGQSGQSGAHSRRAKRQSQTVSKPSQSTSKRTSKTTAARRRSNIRNEESLVVSLSFEKDIESLRAILNPSPSRIPETVDGDGMITPPASQPESGENNATAITDERLLRLSRKLTQRAPLDTKPAPKGEPEVWADSRQALCETVPYFKMPQSGCHQNDRHIYAFLFDGIGHCREYMDTDVIIARAGGGMEVDSSGAMVQKKHHEMDESQVQSVLNDIEHQNPLIIICGDKNMGSVVKMPHRYNVLGWWKPVDVWAEKTMGKGGKTWTTIKYRFERLDPAKKAWHAASDDSHMPTPDEQEVAGSLIRQTCEACHQQYPLIYTEGWMCLNPRCAQFWRVNGEDAPYGKLDYNPAFLLNRTSWPSEEEPHSVRPSVPEVGKIVGDNLTYINTRGICCPECGRCSSRRLFRGWLCDNPSCSYQQFPKHIPVSMPMLHNPWSCPGEGPALIRNKHETSHGVHLSISYKFGYKISTYTFEGIDGKFVHISSNAKINKEPGGPDDMFTAMQQQDDPAMDLRLERRRFGIEKMSGGTDVETPTKPRTKAAMRPRGRPSSRSKSKAVDEVADDAEEGSMSEALQNENWPAGPAPHDDPTPQGATESEQNLPALPPTPEQFVLEQDATLEEAGSTIKEKVTAEPGDFMTAFSMNYGMPYKFVASGASQPFRNAPWPVQSSRGDLNWASQTFLDPANHMDLNELLIFAYMEGQKIEYHDDGESGLGPQIATMSLGGKAKMHMRMKMKHHVGCSKTGVFTPDRPVPSSIGGDAMYQKRLTAWNELQSIKDTDKALYERRRKELPKELGLYQTRHKKAEDLVTITLNHGDIVLMEGYEVQQYLEHKVVPEQCLRFALTCRTVLPEHLKPHERPGYKVEPDDGSKSSLRRMAERIVAEGKA